MILNHINSKMIKLNKKFLLLLFINEITFYYFLVLYLLLVLILNVLIRIIDE